MTTTSCFWPYRWQRPIRCSIRRGFHGRSKFTTREQNCRFTPSAAASVAIRICPWSRKCSMMAVRSPRFREDHGPLRRSHLGHLPEADFKGLNQRAGLRIDADASGPLGVTVELIYLCVEFLAINGGFRGFGLYNLGLLLRILVSGRLRRRVDHLIKQFVLDLLVRD